jgi:hypothetical protein
MHRHLVPDLDRNTCWFCLEQTTSNATVCDSCRAETTPTYDGPLRITYRIYSFGSRANEFSCCQKMHASKLTEAIQVLQAGAGRVAVRVGVKPMFAILIKDADGVIRFSARGVTLLSDLAEIAQFYQASQAILETDPSPTTGMIPTTNSNTTILTLLTRFYIYNTLKPCISPTEDYTSHEPSC